MVEVVVVDDASASGLASSPQAPATVAARAITIAPYRICSPQVRRQWDLYATTWSFPGPSRFSGVSPDPPRSCVIGG